VQSDYIELNDDTVRKLEEYGRTRRTDERKYTIAQVFRHNAKGQSHFGIGVKPVSAFMTLDEAAEAFRLVVDYVELRRERLKSLTHLNSVNRNRMKRSRAPSYTGPQSWVYMIAETAEGGWGYARFIDEQGRTFDPCLYERQEVVPQANLAARSPNVEVERTSFGIGA
jgi:hypothetical protein